MPYRQDQRHGKTNKTCPTYKFRQHRFSIRENRKGLVHKRMLTHRNFHPPPSRTQVPVAVEGLSSISLRKIAKYIHFIEETTNAKPSYVFLRKPFEIARVVRWSQGKSHYKYSLGKPKIIYTQRPKIYVSINASKSVKNNST